VLKTGYWMYIFIFVYYLVSRNQYLGSI